MVRHYPVFDTLFTGTMCLHHIHIFNQFRHSRTNEPSLYEASKKQHLMHTSFAISRVNAEHLVTNDKTIESTNGLAYQSAIGIKSVSQKLELVTIPSYSVTACYSIMPAQDLETLSVHC